MAKPTYARDERPAVIKTLTEIFFESVDAYGDRPAFGRILPSREVEFISFNETLARARCVAGALDSRGIARGERVAIMSPNRLEWALADYGSLCAGVVDVRMILEKSRVPLESLDVRIEAERVEEAPRRFRSIRLTYRLRGPREDDRPKVDRAVELSREKYCSVLHTLRPDLELDIHVELA